MDHQVQELTRYLKPVKETKFNDFDIIQALLKADIDPEEIASVTQLRGARLGVIRVAMRTTSSVSRLDELIKKRKLCIGDVALGEVEESGHFVRVLLENVPLYVSDSDVEEEMAKYGSVIRCEKEYLDFEGCRIANEKRVVLFSNLFQKSLLNKKQLNLRGNTIFATVTHAPAKNLNSAITDDSVNKQLADAVKQLAMARRKSLGVELKFKQREDDLQLDDELLTYLRRRNSFKMKGETNRGQMSSVAYRQSTVVRDVALSEKPNFEIFSWNDAKKLQDKQKDSDVKSEEKNKLGWLKKFSGGSHKMSERPKEQSRTRTKITKTASTTETIPMKESKREVKTSATVVEKLPTTKLKEKSSTKKSGILKTSKANLHQKPKSCNETFNSFVEMRRKQKRNEAFQQLSAYLL